MTAQVEGGPPELLELALELAPAGMLAVDGDGTILLVNREIERLFGYTRDELIGQCVDMLLPPGARKAHPAARSRYLAAPQARPMGSGRDLYGQRADGSQVPVEIGLNPVETPAGRFVLASVVDITTRRETEAQLRQAQKQEAIGTLASGIAHDFNNILMGIMGYTHFLMRNESIRDATARADLQCVARAAERGSKLVERLMAFSRQTEVERSPTQPEAVVSEALGLLRATVPSTIEIREVIDPHTPHILSHETLLHQITVNLATNAAHAMPSGGVLDIELAPHHVADGGHPQLPPGLYARLRVSDTGAGMTPEVLARVTEPFYTTKPVGEGTGLGLSVVHGIVESHGGLLDIQSTPGQGTRVDVYLPAHLPGEEQAAPSVAARKRVLLVEDEAMLLRMQQRHLEECGYDVSGHGSSVEALEVFKRRPQAFDLLVSDNSMPKLTGVELARQVHALRPDLPILLVSGLAPSIEELEGHGVSRVLRKPCPPDRLEETVRELLDEK